MGAPGPAARATLALLKFFLGSPDASFSGWFLLGIFNPTDEFVASQRRYVHPRIECRRVGT
jgi:hypothetical protein